MRNFQKFFIALIFSAGAIGFAAPAEAGFFEELFGIREPAPVYYQAPSANGDATAVAARAAKRAAAKAAKRKAQRLAQIKKARAAKAAAEEFKKKLADALADPTNMSVTPETTASVTKKCCATADEALAALMKDDTLKPGDVVAGVEGMQVYMGDGETAPSRQDFVLVRYARKIDPKLRVRLSAYAPIEELGSKSDEPKAAGGKRRRAEKASVVATPAPEARNTVGAPLELWPDVQIEAQFIVDAAGKRVRFVGGYAPF